MARNLGTLRLLGVVAAAGRGALLQSGAEEVAAAGRGALLQSGAEEVAAADEVTAADEVAAVYEVAAATGESLVGESTTGKTPING